MQFTPKFSRPVAQLLVLFSLLVLVGCGGKPASVTGTVTVDGKALEKGMVTFAPSGGGMRASGIIQDDGSYQIQTNRDIGLEIGEYDVAVVSREVIVTSEDAPPMPGKYYAPNRYGRTKTSGLHFSVEKGSNQIDLELSSEGLAEDNKPKRRR